MSTRKKKVNGNVVAMSPTERAPQAPQEPLVPVCVVRLRIDSGTGWSESGPIAIPVDQVRTQTVEQLLLSVPLLEVAASVLARWREADAQSSGAREVPPFRPIEDVLPRTN